MIDDTHLILHLIYIGLALLTICLYFTDAYFYYVGLGYTNGEGRLILTAIVALMLCLGIRGCFVIIRDIWMLLSDIDSVATWYDWLNIMFQLLVLLGILLFTYATIRRNPPRAAAPPSVKP